MGKRILSPLCFSFFFLLIWSDKHKVLITYRDTVKALQNTVHGWKKIPTKKLSQLQSIHLWWFFGLDHVPRRTNFDCGLNVECMNTNKTGKKCWRKTHKSQKEVFFQLLCYIIIRYKNPKIKNGFEYHITQHRLQK